MLQLNSAPVIQIVLALVLVGVGLWSAVAYSEDAKQSDQGKKGENVPATTTDQSKACVNACGLPTSDAELRKLLTPEQYKIMKENGTEAPFNNEYWNNHADGIYVDRISGVPLFSSKDKFESGTGWPSFTQPIAKAAIVEKSDTTLGMTRTEVRATDSDSHLGHVFDDGPAPTGLRYCMNSASLKFIAVADLQDQGYGQYLPLFGKAMTEPGTHPVLIPGQTEIAAFAGGCFWGVEGFFREIPGVIATEVGYEGGHTESPTYQAVCTHTTGHAETVRISYDPSKVSYDTLLKTFFEYIDPTQVNRQGPDVGDSYRSVIFTSTDAQRDAANAFIADLTAKKIFNKPIATQVEPQQTFWRAELYHQQYFQKNGLPTCHLPQRTL